MFQHCAVASPHPKRKQVTELLLRKGANVNEKNKEWVNVPLMCWRLMLMSVYPSHYLLCLSPLSSLPPLCSFMTPLHVAAERAHNDIMEVLQKHGAKVHSWSCISERHIPACALERLQSCDTHIYTPDTSLHHLPLTAYSIVCLKGIVHQKIGKDLFPPYVVANLYAVKKEDIFWEKITFSSNSSSGQREGRNWSFKTMWTVFGTRTLHWHCYWTLWGKKNFFNGPSTEQQHLFCLCSQPEKNQFSGAAFLSHLLLCAVESSRFCCKRRRMKNELC